MNDRPDPRITPARPDLAARRLQGEVEAARFVDGAPHQVIAPTVTLSFTPAPDARQETQLLYGETFTVYESKDGWAWGQAALDDYVGYLPADALTSEVAAPSHTVWALRSQLYPEPDVKARTIASLGIGCRVHAVEHRDGFTRLPNDSWLPTSHLAPLGQAQALFLDAAIGLLGLPYVWGGRSIDGMDCSGFLQMAMHRAGIACPRDADQQEAALGERIGDGSDQSLLRDGDLVFFPGHVGIFVAGWRFLHANAFDMQVAIHSFSDVLDRARRQENGWITSVRRVGDRDSRAADRA